MTWSELDWSILDRLRDGFLSGKAAAGPYWETHDDLAHYDFTYAARIGWKWDHVLHELAARSWRPPSGPVLDWACGSGIAGRRVLARWPELTQAAGTELNLFDHSTLAQDFARDRARADWPRLTARTWDRTTEPATLLISHVLNELDEDGAEDLADILARARTVLWIEPGTSEVARRLVRWREQLSRDFRIVYPCPHQGACGLLAPGNERHWCHHFAAPPPGIFADSHWVKFGQRAGIDLRSLPYSALVLERHDAPNTAPLPAGAGRIVGRPEVFKPYARLLGCDAQGVAPLELAKRDAPRLVKKLDRADAPRLFRWSHANGRLLQAKPWPGHSTE